MQNASTSHWCALCEVSLCILSQLQLFLGCLHRHDRWSSNWLTGRCWIQHFYFVFAHIVLYCFLCHIYDFFHICCVTFIISSVLYTQLVVCQVIAVFHFRLLNRTYGRICWISTECINRLPVINDRGTIVYLWFCMQCSKRHRHKKYDVCCKLLCLLPEYKIDRENNRNYQTIT